MWIVLCTYEFYLINVLFLRLIGLHICLPPFFFRQANWWNLRSFLGQNVLFRKQQRSYFYHMSWMLVGSAFLFHQLQWENIWPLFFCMHVENTHRKSAALLKHLEKYKRVVSLWFNKKKKKNGWKKCTLHEEREIAECRVFFRFLGWGCLKTDGFRAAVFSPCSITAAARLLILTTLWFILSRPDGEAWEMFYGAWIRNIACLELQERFM